MTVGFDVRWSAIAWAVACLTAVVSLVLAGRISRHSGWRAGRWMLASAAVLGIGPWAMQLASLGPLQLPLQAQRGLLPLAASALLAIVAAARTLLLQRTAEAGPCTGQERLVKGCQPLITHTRPPELAQPGNDALDHPARLAQPAAWLPPGVGDVIGEAVRDRAVGDWPTTRSRRRPRAARGDSAAARTYRQWAGVRPAAPAAGAHRCR